MADDIIVIDLETLDTRPTAAIIAIGAVRFDPTLPDPAFDTFQSLVEVGSAVQAGTVSGATLAFWMQQSDQTRAQFKGERELRDVLLDLAAWFPSENCQVYGYGADFDCVILSHAYRQHDLPVPWKYHNQRCLRTLTALAPSVPFIKATVAHDALADSLAEAEHLIKLYHHFNIIQKEPQK
jgi:hypothetical protein